MNNRSSGAFKRALWYGNNSAVFGQNKGLRKAIRNAPRNVVMGAIGAGMGAAGVPPGVSDVIAKALELAADKGKDLYSDKVKPLIRDKVTGAPKQSEVEALRKSVKKEVKSLKSNAFQVIDRNLVKLRDAKNKVPIAIREMMRAQSHMSYARVSSDLQQMQKAHEAMRTVAETQYYISKILRLVDATVHSLEGIKNSLSDMQVILDKTDDEVGGYVKEHLWDGAAPLPRHASLSALCATHPSRHD